MEHLKIGEFSTLTRVSTVALRYYDELGLLKPAFLDPFTGYRYYTLEQLPHLNTILMLKDLGLSLEQIGMWLEHPLPPQELRRLLAAKAIQVQERIAEEQQRLANIHARIQFIEQENTMPQYEIQIKSSHEQKALCTRRKLENLAAFERFMQEAQTEAASTGAILKDEWIAIYHHEGYREQNMDVEIAIPLKDGAPTPTVNLPFTLRDLAEIPMAASLIYHYSPTAVIQAYTEIGMWIEAQGYYITGACRERFLSAGVIEILFPVERSENVNRATARMDEHAKQVMTFAEDEARQMRHDYIGTEHLVLGLLRAEAGSGVLAELGLTYSRGQQTVLTLMGSGNAVSEGSLRLTQRSRRVLYYANEYADAHKQQKINPLHMLLGILADPKGAGAVTLAQCGITSAQINPLLSSQSWDTDSISSAD